VIVHIVLHVYAADCLPVAYYVHAMACAMLPWICRQTQISDPHSVCQQHEPYYLHSTDVYYKLMADIPDHILMQENLNRLDSLT